MVTPISRLAYAAEYDLMDQAMESERGVQRLFPNEANGRGAAFNFRTRLHKARDYDRKENRKLYGPEDPLYGQTIYAQLTVHDPYWDEDKQAWVLRIVKNQITEMIIEEIPPAREEPEEPKGPTLERRV